MRQPRWSRVLVLSVLAIGLGLLFNNCDRVGGLGAPSLQSNSPRVGSISGIRSEAAAGGDGSGFEGKPEGLYHRYVPNFLCEGRSLPFATVAVDGTQVTFEQNDPFHCQLERAVLSLTDLDLSPFQATIMGFREGIYEHFSQTPKEIPAELVEVWCQAPAAPSDFEMIVHYNRVEKAADARVMYLRKPADTAPSVLAGIEVSRMILNHSVRLQSEQISLTVDRDLPVANRPGEFVGQFKGILDGASVSRELRCRLGGELDPRLWPLESVTSVFVKKAAFMSSEVGKGDRRFAFVSPYLIGETGETSYTESEYLYVFSEKENTHLRLDFKGQIGSSGFGEFQVSPDGRFLYYRSDQEKPHTYALYQYDLIEKTSRRLPGVGIQGAGVRSLFRGGFQIFSDGTLVYISDLTTYSPHRLGYIRGGEPFGSVKFIDSPRLAGQTSGFAYSAMHRQVLFVRNSSAPGYVDLVSHSIDSGENSLRLQKLDINSVIVPPQGVELTGLLAWHQYTRSSVTGLVEKQAMSFRLATGELRSEGLNSFWSAMSQYQTSIILKNASGFELHSVSGPAVTISSYSGGVHAFSKSGKYFWWSADDGIHGAAAGASEAKTCALSPQARVLRILPIAQDQAVALVYRTDLQLLQVITLSGPMETCEGRNRLPIPFEGASELLAAEVSPAGDSLTFAANLQSGESTRFMVYRVPMDGKIPIGITASETPHMPSGRIFFSNDSSRIFLMSAPTGSWAHQVYSWRFNSNP